MITLQKKRRSQLSSIYVLVKIGAQFGSNEMSANESLAGMKIKSS